MPTAACRCCNCRRRVTICRDPRCRTAARRRRDRHRLPRHRRLEPRRPDAGAACRPCACRASAPCATPPRLHFMDNLDPRQLRRAARQAAAPTTRFVAISKSGGTGETLMQTIAALAAVKARRAGDAHSRYFPRPHRAGEGRQAQRPARSACGASRADARSRHRRRRPLLGADQCRAAAGGDARSRYRGDPRRRGPGARAGAGEEAGGARCRPRSAPRSRSRWPKPRARASAC